MVEVQASYDEADEDGTLAALIQRRQGPDFWILDKSLAVVSAWPGPRPAPIDPLLVTKVGEMIAALDDGSTASMWEPYSDGVYLRVVRLNAGGLNHYALFFERSREHATVASAALRFRLSKREAQVLALLMRGYDTKFIATKLSIANTTARDHIVRIMQKSHSRRRSELLAMIALGDR